MNTKKERMETASKIKSILFKDFIESYKPNMTPNSNDFVMLIAGDDLGEEVLSKTFFAGNEMSYASYLYNMIKENEKYSYDHIRDIRTIYKSESSIYRATN